MSQQKSHLEQTEEETLAKRKKELICFRTRKEKHYLLPPDS
jgi:hypothetical protein